ncbi:MAG: four-carbon acid sugar kinase family protein [Chloroflexota bacterium]
MTTPPVSTRSKAAMLESLPPEWPDDPMPEIRQVIRSLNQKVVVLDDDPTGTQTVHDVAVLTAWSDEMIEIEMADPSPAVFVMHNSRSMTTGRAAATNTEIGTALAQTKRPFVVVSRSDSTLRGHYPAETNALANALRMTLDGVLIIPAFMAGGRYTIGDVHYVAEGTDLIPAAETPFAQDKAFGYRHSNLREWVEEKTGGSIVAGEVQSLSLKTIRSGGPSAVYSQLKTLTNGEVCIVNAVTERDLAVVALGALQAEAEGRRLLYRSAASFATIRAGIDLQPPLSAAQLDLPAVGGGLIVVGSYVPKTTAQLGKLLERDDVHGIEVEVAHLLDDATQTATVKRVTQAADSLLTRGETVAVYTSRKLVFGDDEASSLAIGNRVSQSLVDIVQQAKAPLRYLIAKGGITSSDVATQGLGVQRAMVPGQILPGIPVWKLGPESRKPGMAYIVFPGNVGGEYALSEVVTKLKE